MSSSKRKRVQQTQISLSPIPSSSDAASNYHPQIQSRAAAIRYGSTTSSPASKRQRTMPPPREQAVQTLLTPVSTNAPRKSNDGDVLVSKKSRRRERRERERQQRLDFSSQAGMPVSSAMITSSAIKPLDSSDDDEIVCARTKTKKKRGKSSNPGAHIFASSQLAKVTDPLQQMGVGSSEDDDVSHTPATRGAPRHMTVESASEHDRLDHFTRRTTQTTHTLETDDDEDDLPVPMSARRQTPRSETAQLVSSPPPAGLSDEDEDEDDDDDDDDDVVITRTQTRSRPRPIGEVDSPGSGSDAQELSGNESVQQDDDEEELTDQNDLPTTRYKRLKRRSQTDDEEQADLDDDLEFLGSTADPDTPRQPRSTQSKAKTAHANALELLRQKRAGQQVNTIAEDAEPEDEDYDEDPLSHDAPTSSAIFEATEEDDGFLDDGSDEELGVPDDDIPIEFTRYASMKSKELFKFAIEWMVQKKINPAFASDDPLYKLTFKKLNDEITGLVNSKYSSSAWKVSFVQSLRNRPDLQAIPIGVADLLEDRCDACNRKGHPATYEVHLRGRPYWPDTLDDVEQDCERSDGSDDGNDDDDDDDAATENLTLKDSNGIKVPPANTVYRLGRFCMANAETAHQLHHWRYHLYDWVVVWLDKAGYNKPHKIIERDGMSSKKRGKKAQKIVDRMVDEGVVKTLWREFSSTIASAREDNQGRW